MVDLDALRRAGAAARKRRLERAAVEPIKPVNPEREYLHCSHHAACEGPRLRTDHEDVCSDGNDCTDDQCWRGCRFCIADRDAH